MTAGAPADAGWLRPAFASAPARVGAWMTTREGGVSVAPWNALNLGIAVGDDAEAVAENRRRFAAACAAPPVFLRQVHGTRVVRLRRDDGDALAAEPADASITTEPGVACVVQVADCLPVLFVATSPRGEPLAVGAAHAGWRGLAGGVLEATVSALREASGCDADAVEAWLGPCIGPDAFEVGADVPAAFDEPSCFRPLGPLRPGKWLGDLRGLARRRLAAVGVERVVASDACTVGDASRFFSFRRDGVTGRMAAAVWIRDHDA